MNDLVVVILILLLVLGLLVSNKLSPEKVFLTACAALIVLCVIPPAHALLDISSASECVCFIFKLYGAE